MPDTIQSIKVNGTSYRIDYESLENLPSSNTATPGDYLLEETSLSSIINGHAGMNPGIEADVATGDWLRVVVAFTNGSRSDTSDTIDMYCEAAADNTGYTEFHASGSGASLEWSKTDGSYGQLTLSHSGIVPVSDGRSTTAATLTLSVRKLAKDVKTMDPYQTGPVLVGEAGNIGAGLSAVDLARAVYKNTTAGIIIPVTMSRAGSNGVCFAGMADESTVVLYNPNTGAYAQVDISVASMNLAYATYDVTASSLSAGETQTEATFVGSLLTSGAGRPSMIISATSDGAGDGQNTWTLGLAESFLLDADGLIAGLDSIQFAESTGTFPV